MTSFQSKMFWKQCNCLPVARNFQMLYRNRRLCITDKLRKLIENIAAIIWLILLLFSLRKTKFNAQRSRKISNRLRWGPQQCRREFRRSFRIFHTAHGQILFCSPFYSAHENCTDVWSQKKRKKLQLKNEKVSS